MGIRGFVFRKFFELVSKEALAPIVNKPLEDAVHGINGDVQAGGKFTKSQVLYSRVAPPPVFWDYRCEQCRQFVPPSSCRWVEGRISRDGFCALWVPPKDFERPFTWMTRAGQIPAVVVRSARGLVGR